MAAAPRDPQHYHLGRQWRERGDASPERTRVWTEPPPRHRKAAVVYYLSRNGSLEHPHFMEVPLSSPDGLYLRDVITRLNLLRGKGLATMYSWSSKRCYRNGFVWHDLTEDDLIHPSHGNEYVLKGSELHQIPSPASRDASSSSSSATSSDAKEPHRAGTEEAEWRGRKPPPSRWGSFDFAEYRIPSGPGAVAADAATQTDDRRGKQQQHGRSEVPEEDEAATTTELARDDVSPPPASSSPETLETLIKEGRAAAAGIGASGRARASAVLINLISCGAISMKEREELVAVPRCGRPSLLAGGGGARGCGMEDPVVRAEEGRGFPAVVVEDKEYFSGSLIETKKKGPDGPGDLATLKRSNSYNADRCSNLDLPDGEADGAKARCMPRKPKSALPAKKDGGPAVSRSSHGSKRITNAEVPK